MFRKLFDFFVFSSLYISLCAVVMVYQTHRLLLHDDPPLIVSAFVFFATMCSYNFHWYLTPDSVTYSLRIRWAQAHKGWHMALYIIGLTGTIICFFPIRDHWIAISFVAFITFLYSAPKLPQNMFRLLKRVAVGKTLYLSIVWTHVTTFLPLFISGQQLNTAFMMFAISRFGLIYAICILFDYRDREDDRKEGVKSMITFFNEGGINIIFWISLGLFFLTTCALYSFGISVLNIVNILVPGIIVAALYDYSKKNFSDYHYYFVLDGLMMFSGLVMLIGGNTYF